MSGHSKWSTIKHKKAAVDAKRGKLFTRLAKEITIAAREGDPDPDFNPALRLAIDKAKKNNMPNDNIDRAVKRGTGELEGGELFEVVYEGYGPHGVGILIECVTDNKNRAVAEIRHTLGRYNGNMATSGAVAWQFTQKGYFAFSQDVDHDEFFLLAAEAGAEDVQFSDELTEVFTEKELFSDVRDAIQGEKIELEEANLIYDPNNPMDLPQDDALQVMKLIEALEDLDDVQNVYSALEISDEAIAAMEA